MRPPFIPVVLLVAGLIVVSLTGGVEAQDPTTLFVVVGDELLTYTGIDGTTIVRANGAALLDPTGRQAGTISLTSVVSSPNMLFFPTVAALEVNGSTIFVIGLESQPNPETGPLNVIPFRRAAAFSDRLSFGSVPADIIKRVADANENRVFAVRLSNVRADATSPSRIPTNLTINHVFAFIDPRVQGVVGDTNLAVRNRARWDVVFGPGQSFTIGENFNAAAASFDLAFTTNFFRGSDGHTGAMVTCVGTRRPCFVNGTGTYDGYYGFADAIAPASLGVQADAASSTTIREIVADLEEGYGPPRPVLPARPAGLIVARTSDSVRFAWNTVTGATEYRLRVYLRDGSHQDFPGIRDHGYTLVQGPFFRLPFDLADVEAFAVGATDARGDGDLSGRHPVPQLRSVDPLPR